VTAGHLVDWSLGRRIAGGLAGGGDESEAIDAAGLRAVAERALERVLAYSALEPAAALPPAETVSRADWIDVNIGELRELAAPLEARAAGEIKLPWRLGGLVRGALGAAGGVEAGLVVGYASRRVLGQYQVSLTGSPKPPRMLLVGRNVRRTAAELGVDRDRFLYWVAMHEQTHSVQFASVPWLRDHVAGLVGGLIDGASGEVDLSALAAVVRRFASRDPRRAVQEALRGELARALAGPQQAAILDRVQATMAVIEGHAEHVMDAAAGDDEDLAAMRTRLDERRARRGGLVDVIARALGLGMKLRQYELGKAWSDAVVAAAGIDGLNRVWREPGALPTLAELERPDEWLARVATAPVA
jgi:coenzyme F420 biosynthesis associated uncharacterized protein